MMTANEAAEIIDSMTESLRSEPSQFKISIEVTGQSVTSSGSGVGLSINATGGGPGSTTIGQAVNMDGQSIRIATNNANRAMTSQLESLIERLNTIANELRSPEPDRSKLEAIVDKLRGTWVPGVIVNVVSTLVSSQLLSWTNPIGS